MITVHPTAIVSSKAKIGDNVTIGPFVVVEDDVEIGEGTTIQSSAVIYNGARLGKNVKIFQGASVSNIPQDISFANEYSIFEVGDNTTIREFVTLHRGTVSTGMSKIGKNCLLMAYTHVAHDTILGDNVILANAVQVAGHVEIHDYAIIGGMTPVHQFCKVGAHSMTGGGFRITQDLPPFMLASDEPLQFHGLNIIGLRRRGFSNDDIMLLKKAFGYLYSKSLNVSQAKTKIIEEMGDNENIKTLLKFLENSKRGLIGK
ncbi:MAG: acyl-ACP--UDP-N-acetylglucosamine O-acyltransferase [Ignavibacteriaceae bacterium]|nr:acyl-ACP--UDP-N-acetylglucosamine O-acyltransferase [Ignavibacteriaceae bacterium]